MKKTILSALLVAGLSASVFGQGQVSVSTLNNTGVMGGNGGTVGTPTYSSLVTSNGLIFTADTSAQAVNNANGNSTLEYNDVSFVLYGGQTPAAALAGTNLVATLTGANIFTGNSGSDDNPTGLGDIQDASSTGIVPNTTSSAPLYLVLYVWEGSTFGTYAAALTGGDYAGTTGAWLNNSGGGLNQPVALNAMPDLNLTIIPVPEPTTIALAGLSGLALVAFRRRKA